MKTYEVSAKCGHVGKNYYVDRVFAVKANDAKEAAAKVRLFPRVKHDHKDAIRYVHQIDTERYLELMEENKYDEFLHCKSVQEQRKKCKQIYAERQKCICEDEWNLHRKEEPNTKKYYHKKELRNPKKYLNKYISNGEYLPC